MKRKPVEVGLRQGRITVLGEAPAITTASGRNYRAVRVRCECGTEKVIYLDNLPRTFSCGCLRDETVKKPRIDLVGQRFGKLTVLEPCGKGPGGRNHYKVKCSCGSVLSVRNSALIEGNTTACYRCRTRKNFGRYTVSYQGQVFGKLTVLRDWGSARGADGKAKPLCLCQCKCGEQTIVRSANLASGNTTGCLNCKPAGFRDSVEHFLDNEDWASSNCYFYIALVNGQYIKPGISKDLRHRMASSNGFYEDYLFESPLLTRAEAWAIEQRLLLETDSARPKQMPEIYNDWVGRSELRLKACFPPTWFIGRFNELLEELQRSDWYALVTAVSK